MNDQAAEIRFHHSPSLPEVLRSLHCSVLISTYQAGQLIGVGVAEDQVTMSFRRFERAMGVAARHDRIALASRDTIWSLSNHAEIAPRLEPPGRHDNCWLPRASTITGEIQAHELAWGLDDATGPDLWCVNTRFSCLVGLDDRFSFVPRWRPPFVSALAPEDRCHLNGLAMREGSPAFVTMFGTSDEPGGWRALPNDSGVVMDVTSGEVVTTGLSMPHSPRVHDGHLLVLNSGMGRLEHVDVASGGRSVVAAVPGYARGLALHRGFAFIGLSRIRETAIFGGAPIAEFHDQLMCGLGVVDLRSGRTVATLWFDNGIEEIFDVQVVPGTRCPSFGDGAADGQDIWVVPQEAAAAVGA